MDSLEQIKVSLQSNPNLNESICTKLFELVNIFHKKMPNVNLSILNEKLKTVKLVKLSRFEKKGVYFYDLFKNEIAFSSDLKGNYDIDHLLMKAILEMSTATSSYTGFN